MVTPISEITLLRPNDLHVHLRDLPMMADVLPFSDQQFNHILPMPNTDPKLTTGVLCVAYRDQLLGQSRILQPEQVVMVLYLTSETTAQDIHDAAQLGVRACKYYPNGGTTRSGSGLRTPHDLQPGVLRAMEDFEMVLCLHAEAVADDQPDPLQREYDFIPHLAWLAGNYPRLKIVAEHVSDRRMLTFILQELRTASVGASITAHHPFTTHQLAQADPHCLCMPIAKTPKDAKCLAEFMLLADIYPQIWFGSDSAPHPVAMKAGSSPAFGAWTSPVALPVLWDYFYRHKGTNLERCTSVFEAFMTRNGAKFYGLPVHEDRTVTLQRERWWVPAEHQSVVPWKAGESLDWRVDCMGWFGDPDTFTG
ncbi:dihydroorotase [bacterium]|nr:dihydroorotase [bacterium]